MELPLAMGAWDRKTDVPFVGLGLHVARLTNRATLRQYYAVVTTGPANLIEAIRIKATRRSQVWTGDFAHGARSSALRLSGQPDPLRAGAQV